MPCHDPDSVTFMPVGELCSLAHPFIYDFISKCLLSTSLRHAISSNIQFLTSRRQGIQRAWPTIFAQLSATVIIIIIMMVTVLIER